MIRFCLLLAITLPSSILAQDAPIDFVNDVRPILSDKCFPCHGPDDSTRATELRFDDEGSAKADLGGAFAIVPGDLDASTLVARIMSEDEEFQMPPSDIRKRLTRSEIDILRAWITQGAEWSTHWAYVDPTIHKIPTVESDWPKNWIDDFVLRRLTAEGLVPSKEANRLNLVRRLYFDLLGLPPTPEEVGEFVASGMTLEELVDDLLGREQFGERLAIDWLDLVRFADTVGYHGDQDHSITPYRDWVIDAFNSNMPFDRFTREQLAGDLLPDPTTDQIVATGYNRLLQTSHEGGVQQKEYVAIYAADRVRNVSQVWMGATLGCAQCHDHKYDPYSTKDFYSLAAYFADINDEAHLRKADNALPTSRAPEMKVYSRRERTKLAALHQLHKRIQDELEEDSSDSHLQSVEKQIKQIEDAKRKTMITVALKKPRVTRVLPRGDWLDESGEVVEPSVPAFMKQMTGDDRGTRLDLANWLVDSDTGIGKSTARVFVNRLWAQFFGAGLCPSLDDFGGQGRPPVYPKLLDNLSVEFVNSGWDVKRLIRLMLNSRTYRQSSETTEVLRERDPENRWFARQARFRLRAEFIRDNALAVSGLLNPTIGGASFKPYQPTGYYRHLNFPTRTYTAHSGPRQYRRGLYVHWQRQFLHPMFYAFDAPRREECTAERAKSNTPSAALVLLNDPTFVEAARALAAKVLTNKRAKDDRAKIDLVFATVLTRTPDEHESTAIRGLLDDNRDEFTSETAKTFLSIGMFHAPQELDPIELAAWTTVCRALLNLGETNTRM